MIDQILHVAMTEEGINKHAYIDHFCSGEIHHRIKPTKLYLRHWGLICSYCKANLESVL